MAASRGMLALLALLLYCWQEAELQPFRVLTGPITEIPSSSKTQEEVHGVLDEILVQEMLDHSKSSASTTQVTEATLSTRLFKEKGCTHGVLGRLKEVKKKSNKNQNEKLSVLGKTLQTVGRSSGHSFQ
ncbi:sperm acrosome-associated protein 7 [Equus caballus]|uniref:sperm acrosome-associated protein 7 n=1 Tax=Equus caballus TaxID=9796 RepID=UPI000C9E10DD|nr:sperm acrosome-associated protein 7 isoform X1 [Equus caballus]